MTTVAPQLNTICPYCKKRLRRPFRGEPQGVMVSEQKDSVTGAVKNRTLLHEECAKLFWDPATSKRISVIGGWIGPHRVKGVRSRYRTTKRDARGHVIRRKE